MAISFTEPDIETRLERLAEQHRPATSKRGLTLAILDRASHMDPAELRGWLYEPADSDPTPNPPAASAA